MRYGNIDALTKPIDILFALVHSTTRLLNLCLFSLQVCIIYFLFHHCCICISIDFWLLRGIWVTQWKNPAGSTSSFLPVERGKTYFIVPWMLSILLCIRWWAWNVCHDVVVAWLRLPYSFISTPPLCSLPHLHTLAVTSYTGIPVFLFLFYLLLSFIFFPHLHFCFVSQFFGDEWHCLTSMHLSLLPPPPPTRWWYPAFNSSLILFMVSYNPDWLLSIWRGFPSNL